MPIKELEFIVLKTQTNPGPCKFYQTFKEEITILHDLFQKTEEVGKLSNSYLGANITLILKPDKNYRPNPS